MKHLRPRLSQNFTKRNEWGNVVCSTHTRIYYMVCALWSQIAPMFSLCDLSYVSVWIMRVWVVAKWVNIDIPTLFSCFRNATSTTFFPWNTEMTLWCELSISKKVLWKKISQLMTKGPGSLLHFFTNPYGIAWRSQNEGKRLSKR